MKVPRLNGQQVQDRGLSNARVVTEAPLEAFGGGQSFERINRAVQGVVAQADRLAEQEFDRLNRARVVEARTAMNTWERENFDAVLRNRLGKDAAGAKDEVVSTWNKFLEEQEKGLQNDAQRRAFKEMAGQRWHALQARLDDHIAKQSDIYDESVYRGAIESAKERGSSDPRNAPLEAEFIRRAVKDRMERLGLPADEEIKKHESDLYTRGIEALMARHEDLAAEKYFEAVKDRIDPDIQTKIVSALEEGSLRRKGQSEADRILGKAANLTQAMSMTKELDGKLRDEVERRVKDGFSLRNAEKREREERLFMLATNIVEKNKSFDAIPATVVANLPLSARNGLRNYADALRTGKMIETDLATYYELTTMASEPLTKADFLEANLLQYIDRLSSTDFKHFAELQAGLRKGDPEKELELDGIRSRLQVVNDSLRAAGIDPTPKDNDKKASDAANLARSRIETAVNLEARRLGRKLSNEEIAAIAEDYVAQGITAKGRAPFGWGDTKKRRFEIAADEPFAIVDVDRVPKARRLDIEARLRANGLPVTNNAVLEIYNVEVARARARGQ